MRHRPIEIVHLCFSYYPADTRVKREAQALLATGRRIAVIALRDRGAPAVEECDGVLAIRLPIAKSRGRFAAYLREYCEFTWRCRQLLDHHRRLAHARVVHVHTLPDFLLWAALPARSRGARLVLDMHEVFPEFVRAKFPPPVGSPLAAVARGLERWARFHADLTITVNQPIDELLDRRALPRREWRLIIHNTPDPADFGLTRPPTPSLPLGAPLALVYHGTLTQMYGLDLAIRGVARAAAAGTPVRLTIIGDGPARPSLEALARALAPDAVRFEPPMPQRALAARLTACHAGLVPTRENAMTRYSLSTKLLEYVHLGIPVIAARLPSYVRYLGVEGAWYWSPGDPDDLAHLIAQFAASGPEQRMERVRRAQAAMSPYSWALERQRLLSAYERLLGDV